MIVALLFGTALMSGSPDAPPQTAKPVIISASDLPSKAFTLDATPSAAFLDARFMSETAPALRAEAERVLADYEIRDPAVLQRLRLGLAAISILQDRPADAQSLLAAQRAAETKSQLKAIGFLLGDAIAAGARAPAGERCAVAAARISTLLDQATPEVVREEALVRYGRIQVASPGYYAGSAVGVVDPVYEARKSINLMQGMLLSIWRMEALTLPPCREPLTAALAKWLQAPGHQAVDIWAAREPACSLARGPSRWRSGTAVSTPTCSPTGWRSIRPSRSTGRTTTATASWTTSMGRPSTIS